MKMLDNTGKLIGSLLVFASLFVFTGTQFESPTNAHYDLRCVAAPNYDNPGYRCSTHTYFSYTVTTANPDVLFVLANPENLCSGSSYFMQVYAYIDGVEVINWRLPGGSSRKSAEFNVNQGDHVTIAAYHPSVDCYITTHGAGILESYVKKIPVF